MLWLAKTSVLLEKSQAEHISRSVLHSRERCLFLLLAHFARTASWMLTSCTTPARPTKMA